MKLFNRLLLLPLLVVLLGVLTVPAFAAGKKFALDPFHTQVYVTWNHVGFSNPGATIKISKGTLIWNSKDPDKSSVRVTIPVASIDTRVPALNAIFRTKFFQTDKYPTATFKSTSVHRIGVSDHYRVKGQLTLHGITKPVTLHATLNKVGEYPMLKAAAIGFDATTTIKRSAFGVGEYAPLVSDLVRIHITPRPSSPVRWRRKNARSRKSCRRSGPRRTRSRTARGDPFKVSADGDCFTLSRVFEQRGQGRGRLRVHHGRIRAFDGVFSEVARTDAAACLSSVRQGAGQADCCVW